ncbi:hypothetical protein GE061_018805 [Apolygus lucorum]|uniref:Uncharacterized protein n=1 Tax=Apolygus lucorum TaxID=248454 RepID=A0A6A4JPJ8_APOLU|nr:hypothetical protein GE061_018805 [Apolygus lucorum]
MLQSHSHFKPRFPTVQTGQQDCSLQDFSIHSYPSTSILPSTSEQEASEPASEMPLSIKISPPESPVSSSPTFDHSDL